MRSRFTNFQIYSFNLLAHIFAITPDKPSPLVNIVTLYVGSKLYADLITSTPILNMGLISEATKIHCCAFKCSEGKTNIPESRVAA
jgi:hypothetical protein